MVEETKNDTKKNDVAPSTALARVAPEMLTVATPFEMELEPHSLAEARDIANMLAEIHYCGVTSPASAMARIMYGRTLGLTAMASVANVYDIDGKPALESATMLGICLQRPDICEYFHPVSTSVDGATWKAKRRGHPEVVVSFTMKDAERAQLLNRGSTPEAQAKNNYNRFGEDMCSWRCVSRLAKRVFPDLIRGFSTVEERRDEKRLRDAGIVDAEVEHEPAFVPAAIVNSTPTRDFEKEVTEFEALCMGAVDATTFNDLRQTFEAFGDAEPFKSRLKKAYNEGISRMKKAAKAEAKKPE